MKMIIEELKKKGGYDDEIYKRKMYNENFNDSNQI